MPFLPDNELQAPGFAPVALPESYAATPEPAPEGERPSLGATAGASMAIDNIVLNTAKGFDYASQNFGDWDDAHNPLDTIRGTEVEPYAEAFVGSRNQKETDYIARDIRKQIENRKILERSNAAVAFGTSMVASVLSPTTLIPGGAVYRGLKVGTSAGKSALAVGGANAAAAAIDEAILHSQQQTRTMTESGYAIGGSFLLAGILGGAISGVSSAKFRALTRKLEDDLQLGPRIDDAIKAGAPAARTDVQPDALAGLGLDGTGTGAASAGAASTRLPAADLAPAFGTEKTLVKVDPVGRMMNSASPMAREIETQLVELPLSLTRNADGIPTAPRGGSVESRIKTMHIAKLGEALQGVRTEWMKYRFGDPNTKLPGLKSLMDRKSGKLTEKQFDVEVGKAMARGDAHDIPEVAAAAKHMRKSLIDPLAEMAIKIGYLDPEVVAKNRPKYLDPAKPGAAAAAVPPPASPALRTAVDDLLRQVETMTGQKIDPKSRQAVVDSIAANADVLARLREIATGEVDIPFALRGGDGPVGRSLDDVLTDLENGHPVVIERAVTDRIDSVMRDVVGRFPDAARAVPVAYMTGVDPLGNGLVRVSFIGIDGGRSSINITLDEFAAARAAEINGRILTFASEFDSARLKVVEGEIQHELAHALIRRGVIGGDVAAQLVAHSNALGVLDMTFANFKRRIGLDASDEAQVSIRERYSELYGQRNVSDVELQRMLDEEALAHMVELRAHGALTDAELAPVAADLDALFGTVAPRGDPVQEWMTALGDSVDVRADGSVGVGDAMFAVRQDIDTGRSMLAARDLDMSPAARKARAQEMGFDTSRVLYHATNSDFDEFRPSERGNAGPGVYVSNDVEFASLYGNRVIELYVKGELATEAQLNDAKLQVMKEQGIAQWQVQIRDAASVLRKQGYSGIETRGGEAIVVFDPRSIRSVNAAFDPAKSDSANLLFALRDAADIETGQPSRVMVHHGMPSPMKGDRISSAHARRFNNIPGTWFATDHAVAKKYGTVHSGEMSLRNPLVIDGAGDNLNTTLHGSVNEDGDPARFVVDKVGKTLEEANGEVVTVKVVNGLGDSAKIGAEVTWTAGGLKGRFVEDGRTLAEFGSTANQGKESLSEFIDLRAQLLLTEGRETGANIILRNKIRGWQEAGHDAVVFRNVRDYGMPPHTQILSWTDNSVMKSDGSVLFALRDLSDRMNVKLIDDMSKDEPHPGKVMAVHGTKAHKNFDTFDPEMSSDFGIHFGTKDQADIVAGYTTTRENARMIPVVLDLRTVVDVPDMMTWPPLEVAAEVEKQFQLASGLAKRVEAAIAAGPTEVGVTGQARPTREALALGKVELRKRLSEAGIDGLRYWNDVEGDGWSYIVWDEGKVTSAITGQPMLAARNSEALRKIRALGGIKDVGGDLKAMGVGDDTRGIINNKTGLDPDVMRDHMVQAGYLQDAAYEAETRSIVQDLYDLIDAELRAPAATRPSRDETSYAALRAAQKTFEDAMGVELKLTPEQEDQLVAFIVDRRMSIDDALERFGMMGDDPKPSGKSTYTSPERDVSARRFMDEMSQRAREAGYGSSEPTFSKEIGDEVWDAGDQTYITRLYDRQKIKSQRPKFKAIITDYFEQSQQRAVAVLSRLRRQAEDGRVTSDMAKNIEDLQQFTSLSRQDLADTADTVIDHILGATEGRITFDLPAAVRGPLKSRTLRIADAFESTHGKFEDFLDRDINAISRFYTRTMGPDIEIIRRFGSLDLKDQIAQIGDDFKKMIESPELDKLGPRKAELARRKLDRQREVAVRDLLAQVDRLRGTYAVPDDPMSWGPRTIRVFKAWNYLRMLGGMVVSAVPDVFRPMMVHGVTSYFGDGLRPFVGGLPQIKMASGEVKLAGTALDMVLSSRAMAIADVMDDYGRLSKFERGLGWAQDKFGTITLMNQWNTAMKSWAGMITMNNVVRMARKIADGTASKADVTKMAAAGIDSFDARLIADQFAKHGIVERGVYLPNTQAWDVTDPNVRTALETFRAAIVRDVDRIIVTPGQDKPLFMSTQLGGLAAQFKSFGFASMQRTLVAGLQQRDAGVVMGALLMVGMGTVVEYLKALGNDKPLPKTTAQWVAAGVDRSGLMGWLADANNITEKLTGGVVGASAFTGRQQSRYASRDWVGAVAGPTVGTISELVTATSGFSKALAGKEQLREADVAALRRLIPMQNLFYLSYIFQKLEQAASDGLGAKPSSRTQKTWRERTSDAGSYLDEFISAA